MLTQHLSKCVITGRIDVYLHQVAWEAGTELRGTLFMLACTMITMLCLWQRRIQNWRARWHHRPQDPKTLLRNCRWYDHDCGALRCPDGNTLCSDAHGDIRNLVAPVAPRRGCPSVF